MASLQGGLGATCYFNCVCAHGPTGRRLSTTLMVGAPFVLYDFLPLPLCRGSCRRSSDRGPLLLQSGWTPRWHRCGAGRFVWPLYDRICAVGHPLFISFLFLRIKATAGGREIEVHHCCCSGGFLGGLGAGRGGLWLIYNI